MAPILSGHVTDTFHLIVEWAAFGIELLAVAIVVAAVIVLVLQRGTVRYLFQLGKPGAYQAYKDQLGRPLLLGFQLMVTADVVRTITFEPTLKNVVVLGCCSLRACCLR